MKGADISSSERSGPGHQPEGILEIVKCSTLNKSAGRASSLDFPPLSEVARNRRKQILKRPQALSRE